MQIMSAEGWLDSLIYSTSFPIVGPNALGPVYSFIDDTNSYVFLRISIIIHLKFLRITMCVLFKSPLFLEKWGFS